MYHVRNPSFPPRRASVLAGTSVELVGHAAPAAFGPSAFASNELVAITPAPAALANCNAKTDTPPLPWNNPVEPGRVTPSTNSARHAVSPAQVSVAASAADQPCGARVNQCCGVTTVSRA